MGHLATIDDMAQHITTMIPSQVLADIDNARNPMQLTRERLERAATENQFMNGKISAVHVRSASLLRVYLQIREFAVIPQVS